jgi:phosphoglycerate dehydrogenase-like enzyme
MHILRTFCLVLSLGSALASAADLPANLQGLELRESAIASRDLPGWSQPTRIVVRNVFGAEFLSGLKAAAAGAEVVEVRSVAEAVAGVKGAQVLVGFCDEEVLAAGDALRFVQVFFAGVEDCVSTPSMQSGKLTLSNGQRLSSPTIAEHTIGLMYSLVRGLDRYQAAQLRGEWSPDYDSMGTGFGELSGRTLLVVGLGGIGSQVAQRAHALGMRVIATRGSRREGPDYVEYVGLAPEAVELARRADIVVNAAPLTAATTGMFNAQFFAAMKPSAYFISVGRGQSTVTEDLLEALRSGQIAGAALDVTDPEPLPQGHALWTTPRVIITPHVAARSLETLGRIGSLVAENLRRYSAGEPLLSVVDVRKGY